MKSQIFPFSNFHHQESRSGNAQMLELGKNTRESVSSQAVVNHASPACKKYGAGRLNIDLKKKL